MKKIILIMAVAMSSCEFSPSNTATTSQEYGSGGQINFQSGSMGFVEEVYEAEYKGHTYVMTEVHGGMCMAHAGHCKCNTPKTEAQ